MRSARTIHKFPLYGAPGDTFIIKMPEGAKILHFGAQLTESAPCIWAEVYPQNSLCDRLFTIVGTGWLFPEGVNWQHVGTVFMLDGRLVWHLYEDVGYGKSGPEVVP